MGTPSCTKQSPGCKFFLGSCRENPLQSITSLLLYVKTQMLLSTFRSSMGLPWKLEFTLFWIRQPSKQGHKEQKFWCVAHRLTGKHHKVWGISWQSSDIHSPLLSSDALQISHKHYWSKDSFFCRVVSGARSIFPSSNQVGFINGEYLEKIKLLWFLVCL